MTSSPPRGAMAGRSLADLMLLLVLHVLVLEACVSYRPRELTEVPFLERAERQQLGGVSVTAAALSRKEARELFGVNLGGNGIQPVWLEISNGEDRDYLFYQHSLDPDYFAAREAANKSHFSATKRIFGYGLLSLLFFPLVLVLPLQYVSARSANREMDDLFVERALGNLHITPQSHHSGFVFTHLDEGTKEVRVGLLHPTEPKNFDLYVQVPGVRLDYQERAEEVFGEEQLRELDWPTLRAELEALPCCTTRPDGSGSGDPMNLIVIGTPRAVIQSFTRAAWDETEVIDPTTSFKTMRSFVFGSSYRYSPVSNLYYFGRQQDIAFQKTRESIHERNHLRLWQTPYLFEGKNVFVGAVSRDIGVIFTTRAWNLTTHAIDEDIDDSREAVTGDLLQTGRVSKFGYIRGLPASSPEEPARNLMDAPYFTDGLRAVSVLSEQEAEPTFFNWGEAGLK